jgi:uncharacterized protein (TIGR03437 family)
VFEGGVNMVKLVFLLMPAVALAYEYGPNPRYTAAPGDDPMSCASAQCHTSNSNGGPINAGGGGVTATFPGGSLTYTPGGPPIMITVAVTDPVNTGYGFQMTARLDSDLANGQAGDFTAGTNQIVLCDDSSFKPSGKSCPSKSPVEFIEHYYPMGTAVKNTTPYTFTWTPPARNVGPVHFYVAGNAVTGKLPLTASGADHVYTASYVLTPAGSTGPVLDSGSVANGATYVAGGLVPGSWAQVKGTGLSSVTRIWADSDFNGLGSNLPTNLSGVQVMVNNLPAAIYYIDSGQVSFQVPSGISGTASVQVINNNVPSNTVTGAAASVSPGIFPIIVNGTNYPAAVFAKDGLLAGDPSVKGFRKANPGESVQLYTTGLVQTSAGVVVGAPQTVSSSVTVTIGSTTVNADFAGLVAVGEFQINFKVPNLATGSYPISVTVGGVSSPATIDSNPPGPIVLPIGP